MTPDEFRKSIYYTPAAEEVLEELAKKYDEYEISPPVIDVEGDWCCRCLIWWKGKKMLVKTIIPIKKPKGW